MRSQHHDDPVHLDAYAASLYARLTALHIGETAYMVRPVDCSLDCSLDCSPDAGDNATNDVDREIAASVARVTARFPERRFGVSWIDLRGSAAGVSHWDVLAAVMRVI